MPIYNRRTLRQDLSREWLRDIVVGRTSGSWGLQAGSFNIIDSSQADPTASGEQLYTRHYLRLLGSLGFIQDLRVGSFNTGSGAFLGAQTLATTIFSGMSFEVHGALSPAEKDLMLTRTIEGLGAMQQEIPVWTIDQSHVYSLGSEIVDVVGVRYLADPTNSLNRSPHHINHFNFIKTATGQELRISPALTYSYQLILEAITTLTLGAGDLATINLPSEQLALAGTAMRCYWLMEQNSPGRDNKLYKDKRMEAAASYRSLAARFQPIITRRIQLEERW